MSILSTGPCGNSSGSFKIRIKQEARDARIRINGATEIQVGVAAAGGGIGIVADKGMHVHVSRFSIDGRAEPGSWFLLPLEGLIGAGNSARDWTPAQDGFRYGTGYAASFDAARAKWNFRGSEARLWSPRGPGFGEVEIFLDGESKGRISLHAGTLCQSEVVWASEKLMPGYHALMIVRLSGGLPVDCVEFVP
jgi:hypothetical protein